MTRLNTILAATIATATLIAGAAPAAAKVEPTVTNVSVRYSDLNLSTIAGRKSLETRIKRAVSTACGGRPEATDWAGQSQFEKCSIASMQKARGDIAAITGATLASR